MKLCERIFWEKHGYCREKWISHSIGQERGISMPIIMRLDRVMADRKMSLKELSEKVGVANVNLSKMKTGKISAIRFSTLEAICDVLDCQPGDILEYKRAETGD